MSASSLEPSPPLSPSRLAAKFDEELRLLLDKLRQQAHREWNLAHLCARLDYNGYWSSTTHAGLGPAASLSAAAAAHEAAAHEAAAHEAAAYEAAAS